MKSRIKYMVWYETNGEICRTYHPTDEQTEIFDTLKEARAYYRKLKKGNYDEDWAIIHKKLLIIIELRDK